MSTQPESARARSSKTPARHARTAHPDTLLDVSHVTVQYQSDARTILGADDVSFTIAPASRLTGANVDAGLMELLPDDFRIGWYLAGWALAVAGLWRMWPHKGVPG